MYINDTYTYTFLSAQPKKIPGKLPKTAAGVRNPDKSSGADQPQKGAGTKAATSSGKDSEKGAEPKKRKEKVPAGKKDTKEANKKKQRKRRSRSSSSDTGSEADSDSEKSAESDSTSDDSSGESDNEEPITSTRKDANLIRAQVMPLKTGPWAKIRIVDFNCKFVDDDKRACGERIKKLAKEAQAKHKDAFKSTNQVSKNVMEHVHDRNEDKLGALTQAINSSKKEINRPEVRIICN